MIKHIIVSFLFISLFGIGYFYFQHDKNELIPASNHVQNEHFVNLKNGKFSLDGKSFFPMMLNFVVALRTNDTIMWPDVYLGYVPNGIFLNDNRDSSLSFLKAHLTLVKDMGFNTIRAVGIGEPNVQDFRTGRVNFRAIKGRNQNISISLDNEDAYRKYLSAIEDLLNVANEVGLKVMLTTRIFHEAPATEHHLIQLAKHFKNNTTLFAYDFFNEPLYFDSIGHTKSQVYHYTKKWHRIIDTFAPDQLCTVGLACQRELFVWDPNLVDVDFLALHPYDYEPDQVRNEMYWYSKYIKKPWMLGETGRTSNNDSIPYEAQVAFAHKTLLQTINCGGLGYAWWQFKDVDWGTYDQNYLGVVNRVGETRTSKGDIISGTTKPVIKEFIEFNPNQIKSQCNCMPNYYNMTGSSKFRIIGKLLDIDGSPLDGGGILAWDMWWINHHFTVTKNDGSFELYSDYKYYHWMVSASMYEMIRKDINPDTAKIINGVPTINIGSIKLKKVDLDTWKSYSSVNN